jgi:site-specific DNA-methyltransferase (adenine-specific)/modification methylase
MAIVKEERIGAHRLILGDCLEVMPLLGAFDAVVTDPPYGIGESQAKNLSRNHLAECTVYAGNDFDHLPAAPEAIQVMRDISKYQIIFGGNYFDLPPTKCWLVWDKQTGESDFADCELAWSNMDRAVRRIVWQWSGFLRKGEARGVKRVHLTQKPVEVMEWCLGFLPKAQTILDPFMGSGTTGVACQKLGRAFTGIELDPDYFDIACKRIDEAMRQPDLFVEPPAAPTQEALDI